MRSFRREMRSPKKRRWAKLAFAQWGIILLLIGPFFLTPVHYGRPVLDSEELPVFGEDGKKLSKTDYWRTFRANWMAHSLIYAGIGGIIWGIGGWLYLGVRPREMIDRR